MLSIVVKETKEFLRDKTNIFFFILFPSLMVFLLGSLLGSMDQAEKTIGDISVQYMIETEQPYHVMSIEEFIQQLKVNSSVKIDKMKDLDTAKKLAANDEITAAVVFSGDPLEIKVYEGSDRIKNRTIGAILNGYIQTSHAVSAVLKISPASSQNIGSITQEEYVTAKDLGVNRTMMDYYAVAMVAMTCFWSMLLGAVTFTGERQGRTINRLLLSPTNRCLIFLQKIMGSLPQVILQITVVMLISVFILKASYASNLMDNLYLLLMFFVVCFCNISVGAVLGVLLKKNPMVFVFPILWLMMFFGGTYSKEVMINGVTEFMPIYQVQQAAFDLSIFGRYQKANCVILICLIMTMVALATGAFIFGRKGEEG